MPIHTQRVSMCVDVENVLPLTRTLYYSYTSCTSASAAGAGIRGNAVRCERRTTTTTTTTTTRRHNIIIMYAFSRTRPQCKFAERISITYTYSTVRYAEFVNVLSPSSLRGPKDRLRYCAVFGARSSREKFRPSSGYVLFISSNV